MKTLLKIVAVLVAVFVAIGVGIHYAAAYWKSSHPSRYRTVTVDRGEVTSVVNSTGTIQPIRRVQVGTFVSGPVSELNVDFNSRVKKGQLMALIDPQIYQAAVDRDTAAWLTAQSERDRTQALLDQSINDDKRAQALRRENPEYISESEVDKFKYTRKSLEAQLGIAKAGVLQAEANLKNSKASLGYTKILAPVDGIVIDRKVDQGQTVAAQFQTPELFTVAPEMEQHMYIYSSVDEADIGLVRNAEHRKQPIRFTVDTHPDDLFEGIYPKPREDGTNTSIRLNPTTSQNVVTYTVVVEAPNRELKLLPGMTAKLSFQIEKHENVLRIPNAALRFYPKPEQVRPEDRPLLEGVETTTTETTDEVKEVQSRRSASERSEANRRRTKRHVWVAEGEFLRAVPIVTGLNDNQFSELISGELSPGDELVTGQKPAGM